MLHDPVVWVGVVITVAIVVRFAFAAARRIAPAEAKAKVAAGGILLDVRTEAEHRGGAIPGSLNIPVQSLAARLDELPRDRPIIVYCASGMRSASATSMLRSRGYDAHDLGPGSRW